MGRFERWCDPDGYGNGTWGRHVAGGMFHVIEVTDMDEACGRDNEGREKYVVELHLVDLDALTDKAWAEAKKSCGWEGMEDTPRIRAEVFHRHGNKAPLHSVTTDNRGKGYAECRKESYRLSGTPGALDEALMKPANKIGATALEFMQGDINSAMVRGVANGDPSAKLMAKMYGAPQEKIDALETLGSIAKRCGGSAAGVLDPRMALQFGRHLRQMNGSGGQVALKHPDLLTLSGDDPLPAVYGYTDGFYGKPTEGPREELATAYLAGYKLGTEVRLGEKPAPEWIQL